MAVAFGAASLIPLTTTSLASSAATTTSLSIISASFCRLPHPQSHCRCIPPATPIGLRSCSSIRKRFQQIRASAAEEAEKRNVLVVNTNSGGHAFIGFWVAKELRAAGHHVTVFTVGAETSEKMKKPPFSHFSELREIGVETVWGDPSSIGAKFGSNASFDTVLDNNGKDLEAVRPVADWANESGAGQFLFVSSAGIYKVSDELPHIEGDAVKVDAGHVGVEDYIGQLSFQSWASFRPQYMTGFGNNKDCEEWFFDSKHHE